MNDGLYSFLSGLFRPFYVFFEKLLHGALDHLSILSPEKDYIGRRNRTLILLDGVTDTIMPGQLFKLPDLLILDLNGGNAGTVFDKILYLDLLRIVSVLRLVVPLIDLLIPAFHLFMPQILIQKSEECPGSHTGASADKPYGLLICLFLHLYYLHFRSCALTAYWKCAHKKATDFEAFFVPRYTDCAL